MDVKEMEGIWCIEITPEAGDVKTSEKRLVPLHSHLLEQGFLDFAARKKGKRPLFYSLDRQRGESRESHLRQRRQQTRRVGEGFRDQRSTCSSQPRLATSVQDGW
jgi:hypothetical protein